MSKFSIIDTETTWSDRVMSIGVVVADTKTFKFIDKQYFILTDALDDGGMYFDSLYTKNIKPDFECTYKDGISKLKDFLINHKIKKIFAYNASFDHRHLPELHSFDWYDIMKLAAYRQHNTKIPEWAECHSTGRLKRDYGVENMYRLLSDDDDYCEMHNALTDAIDELHIMKMLNHGLGKYIKLLPKK